MFEGMKRSLGFYCESRPNNLSSPPAFVIALFNSSNGFLIRTYKEYFLYRVEYPVPLPIPSGMGSLRYGTTTYPQLFPNLELVDFSHFLDVSLLSLHCVRNLSILIVSRYRFLLFRLFFKAYEPCSFMCHN